MRSEKSVCFDRVITQTIAADLFDRGASAVRYPSCLDGLACIAVFEQRGTFSAAGDPIALTDPPPGPLTKVTAPWGLVLERTGSRQRPQRLWLTTRRLDATTKSRHT